MCDMFAIVVKEFINRLEPYVAKLTGNMNSRYIEYSFLHPVIIRLT